MELRLSVCAVFLRHYWRRRFRCNTGLLNVGQREFIDFIVHLFAAEKEPHVPVFRFWKMSGGILGGGRVFAIDVVIKTIAVMLLPDFDGDYVTCLRFERMIL